VNFQIRTGIWGHSRGGCVVVVERSVEWEDQMSACLKANITSQEFRDIRVYACENFADSIRDAHARGMGNGQAILVYDMAGSYIGLNLARRVLHYVRASLVDCSLRYVGCTRRIILVNGPAAFRFIWPLVRAFLPEITKKKIHVVTSAQPTLADFSNGSDPLTTIEASSLPVSLGGSVPDAQPLRILSQPMG